jgi:ankyrin repeat protein
MCRSRGPLSAARKEALRKIASERDSLNRCGQRILPLSGRFGRNVLNQKDSCIALGFVMIRIITRRTGLFRAVRASLPLMVGFSVMGGGGDSAKPTDAGREIDFVRDIKPVLERSCVQCHSGEKPKGGLRLESREPLLKGGESKEAAIIPGQGAKSQLVRFASDSVKEMEMPPLDKRGKYPALKEAEVGLIRRWIDEGAAWPEEIVLSAAVATEVEAGTANSAPVLVEKHPVFEMIRRGDRRGIAKVLQDPEILRVRDENGNTPLIEAAFYLEAKQLALFLDQGGEVNATNNAGVTALMKAVWDVKKTKLLLERKADVNAASKIGNTALIIASYAYDAAPVVKELIAHGANVRATNRAGGNALTAAAEAGNVEVVRTLLDHGAAPDSKTRIVESGLEVSALMIAAQLGHLDCVKLLLERGADPNLRLEHGTALHFAVITERTEVVRLLLERGVDVNVPGRRLLSFRNDTGLTPLMYASLNERNDPTIVQWLLERGAEVNVKASSGDTPLDMARRRGNTKVVSALLAAGTKDDGTTAELPNLKALWSSKQVEKHNATTVRKAAEAGVSVLVRSGERMTEATGNRCASCHQQNLPALAWSTAAARGVGYPEQIAKEQLKATIQGSKRFGEFSVEQPPPVPNIAAWLLIGLDAAEYPAGPMTDSFAYALARYQHGDGRWVTKAWRPPTDYSDVTSTALAIRALKVYAPPTMKKRIDGNIRKAAAWLTGYEPESVEERAMQILGLHWAGSHKSQIKKLAKGLLIEQRADGGWAQLSTLETDAYATGLALFALNQAAGLNASDDTYQNGVKYLLSTQLDDGSWFVKTRASPVQVAIKEVFPHEEHQWISSIATGWSSIALMLATERDTRQAAVD